MGTVRMRDIAVAAGVSTSTVSKVLSGGPGAALFNAQTAQRVRSAATRMGYVPNRVARNLRARRTHEVGMVLGEAPCGGLLQAETFDGRLLLGLTEAAAECHLAAVVIYPRESSQRPSDISRYLDGRIDGLIVRCVGPGDEQLLRGLAPARLPLVALWRQNVPEGVGYVDTDHYGGMYRAVQHLLELGHRRIACVAPADLIQDGAHPHLPARYRSYQDALIDAGITPRPEWGVPDAARLLALLDGPEPVTAACALNDTVAREVVAALEAAGVRIPEDLSLIGFDNMAGDELLAGGLTTVHHPIREMGSAAIRCLVALIGGAPVAQCRAIVPAHLVVRRSTAPIAP